MTVVERVARAIAIGTAHDPDVQVLDEGPMWKQFVPAAHAAIAAIREPDYELIQILKDKMIGHGGELTYPQWIKLWQSVIDVALGEK